MKCKICGGKGYIIECEYDNYYGDVDIWEEDCPECNSKGEKYAS